MDIIVKGRRTEVNDRFKRHVDTKLAKIEKLDSKIIRVDVEVTEERNPRQADQTESIIRLFDGRIVEESVEATST